MSGDRVSAARRARLTATAAALQLRERRIPFASPERIERRQRRNLRAVVAHAHRHVPYYRETMGRLGIGPADIATEADLAKLPVIEREQLQRDPEYFRSELRDERESLALRSGGSSSTPVTVVRDPMDLVRKAAALARVQPMAIAHGGRRWRRRVARIAPAYASGTMFRDAYLKNLLRPLDPRTVPLDLSMELGVERMQAAIDEFRPHILTGYGSAVEEQFAHAVASGRPFHRPGVVIYGADALSDAARRMIDGLGITILSVYQAIESPQIGFECDHHTGLHINTDICPVRILDDEGREAAPGEPGHVVISDLIGEATVLLNYRLGDLAAKLPDPCPCGRTLPMLSFVQGRSGRPGVGADGRPLPRHLLIRPFSLDEEVWGYRVEQLAPGRFDAQVLAAAGADTGAIASRVRSRFAEIVGPGESVEISFVDSLPRTPAGKVVRFSPGAGSAPSAPGTPAAGGAPGS